MRLSRDLGIFPAQNGLPGGPRRAPRSPSRRALPEQDMGDFLLLSRGYFIIAAPGGAQKGLPGALIWDPLFEAPEQPWEPIWPDPARETFN